MEFTETYEASIKVHNKLKAPNRCAQLFDHECSLITDKHTEVLDFISCVQTGEHPQPSKRTDGRDQTYYLPLLHGR